MKAFRTLLRTECKLSLRGLDMFIFAICMPVTIFILLGIIYKDKPAFEGAGYTFVEQSFGAVSTIAICAGGVMGLPLVVSDYRKKHILKRFQVTPASPVLILAVQLSIYAFYSFASLVLLYTAGVIFFDFQLRGSVLTFLAAYLLVMVSMFSIGLLVGGIAPDIKTASAAASILYFPMIIFSGATLPYEIMPSALQKCSDLMPLTQGIKLLKAAVLGSPVKESALPVYFLAGIGFICAALSLRFFRWE
ncbi:ABC-2 type transport system permease protein [Lacrimispora xylanisolvens]|uniref:Transport permease protein n=1 Tax=Lacrimispora xylanisolvens TaxID=384636 RepID=A0A2S6HRS9_9FIRM|nr:ABC transporter permease [Hungatella xylanolytica]PPK80338.1 ABC-2 type transport system permease protein [Hungatella xylanolytica]